MSPRVREKHSAAYAMSFEKIIERLEGIVERLGKGDLPLEESLRLFEEGVHLSREGHRILDEAESKVEVLLESGETAPLRAREVEDVEDD